MERNGNPWLALRELELLLESTSESAEAHAAGGAPHKARRVRILPTNMALERTSVEREGSNLEPLTNISERKDLDVVLRVKTERCPSIEQD